MPFPNDNLICRPFLTDLKPPVAALKIYDNSILADDKTQRLFGPYSQNNGRNDCADAFRHAYFNLLNTRRVGEEITRKFAEAHECDSPSAKESEMDFHNNEIGIELALQNPSMNDLELTEIILDMLFNGDLRIISNLNEYNGITIFSQVISSESCTD